MNNLRLWSDWLVKLLLSAVLSIGAVAQVNADTQYGPIKAGETLSSIVNENYLFSPIEDLVIMREIFRMNPQAFIANNVGLVKQGAMLTLPSDAKIRRAQQQGSNAQASQRRPRPATRELAQSLDATLRQARKDRDEAKQQLRRAAAQSTSQIESFDSRVKRLEADKRTIAQRLEASLKELANTQQSLEAAKLDNSRLKANPVNVEADSELAKKLEESKLVFEEKQNQVNELELLISALKAAADAKEASHEFALDSLRQKNQRLEEQQLALKQQASISSSDSEQVETRFAKLKRQHQQQLDQLRVSLEAKNAEQLNSDSSELEVDQIDPGLAIDNVALTNDPLTKKFLIQHLEKPVVFPLWGLLLAAFTLGFLSLMMLFTKSRRPAVSESAVVAAAPQVAENKVEEKLVFRASDSSLQDPDIETLRVPARRDSSRVAILDPTMVDTNSAAAEDHSAVDSKSGAFPVESMAVEEGSSFDAKFKLLLAETYEEIGDNAAANELLLEVQQEGNADQKMVASSFLARLDYP